MSAQREKDLHDIEMLYGAEQFLSAAFDHFGAAMLSDEAVRFIAQKKHRQRTSLGR